MSLAAIPRRIVRLGFAGAHIPVAVADRLARRSGLGPLASRPVAAAEAVESRARDVAALLLRDDSIRRPAPEPGGVGEESTGDRAEIVRLAEERRAQLEREEEAARRVAEDKAREREAAERRAAASRAKAAEAKRRRAELAAEQARGGTETGSEPSGEAPGRDPEVQPGGGSVSTNGAR